MNSTKPLPTTAGLEKLQLKQLEPDRTRVFVVGIIIAKQRPRKFSDNRSGDSTSERAVWNFTLRDSPICYINVTCWGFKENIFELNDKFHVGDVVDLIRPTIEIRKINDYGENFRPKVTSPYSLTLSEGSEMIIHLENCQPYYQLLHLPTKPIAGAYTLADVHSRKNIINGVDLLGVVRVIGKSRNIITRGGIEQQVREVVILDQTSPALKITIWDPDVIVRAGTWRIGVTVLFITDVRCEWSSFARSMVATLTSRTVLTEDPIGVEVENLRKYANETPLPPSAILNPIASSIPNPLAILNVMNVQQVLDKTATIVNSTNLSVDEQQFTALLYVVITQLDLDGLFRKTTTKCSRCNTIIIPPPNTCTNSECPVGSGQAQNEPVTDFDLRLMLSDQTGSLVNCRLNGQTAETVLNCTVQEFLAMSDEEKSVLKWKFLMERCAIRILVMCAGFRSPIISILSCDLAAPFEVANRLPHS